MAQKYNPSTGQWEEEDEDSSSFNSGTAAFGSGAPAMQQFQQQQVAPTNPWEGAQVGLGDLYTSYDIAGSPGKYGIKDKSGKDIEGFGYYGYDKALEQFEYSRGRTGQEGAWGHSALNTSDNPEFNPTFGTEAELRNALNAEGLLSLDARTKYGSALPVTDLLRSRQLEAYLSDPNYSGIKDLTYHRDPAMIQGNFNISGENSLYGNTEPVIKDGKVIGYQMKTELMDPSTAGSWWSGSPYGMSGGDSGGRVTSGHGIGRSYNDPTGSGASSMGDGKLFVPSDKTEYFPGWSSSGSSFYNKEKGGLAKFLTAAIPLALGAFALGPAGLGAWGAGGVAAGTGAAEMGAMAALGGETALGGGIGLGGGLGFSGAGGIGLTGEIAGLGSMGFGGATAAGLAGTGLGAGWAGLGDAVSAGLSGVSDFNDFTSMFDTVKQGQGALGELSNSIGNMGMDSILPQSSLELPGSSMPGSSAIDIPMGPPEASSMEGLYLDDFGGGTNAMGEFTNGRGMLSPQDRIATSLRQLGMDRVQAADLTQGANKMYNFMTEPMGGKRPGMFQAPSPLNTLFRAAGAYDSVKQNKKAMDLYENQLNQVSNYQDPNGLRGAFANQRWQQTVQDPSARYREWMSGAGGIMRDQLAAQAAKSGKRGSYLNSGALMRDMYKNSLADQDNYLRSIQGGFATSPNNAAEAMKYTAPLANSIKNQNAPYWQVAGDAASSYGLANIYDTVKGWF